MLGCGWSREGARAGGGTRVVEGGSWYARGRSGGWPGRAFLRIGTLEGDGGGGLWEAPVAERAVRGWGVLHCLGGDGAGNGGVFGGGEKAGVMVPVTGWTPNGVGCVGSVSYKITLKAECKDHPEGPQALRGWDPNLESQDQWTWRGRGAKSGPWVRKDGCGKVV